MSNAFSQGIGVEVIIQPDPTTGKDAFISSSNPSTNYGSYEDLVMLASGTTNLMRALIKFDLSSIPTNVGIETVGITLRGGVSVMTPLGNSYPSTLPYTQNLLWLERVTQNWQESTVNWSNQPLTTQIDRAQVAASTSNIDYICNIQNSYSLMNMVQNMVSNPSSNYGFMFKLQNEDGNRNMAFKSSDYIGQVPEKYRPQIHITYSIPDFTYCFNSSNPQEYTFNSTSYSSHRVQHQWIIDGDEVSQDRIFTTNLSQGIHQICHTITFYGYYQDFVTSKCITICVY
ncbi:MAG: DNRLRE domain-containing protein [Bacteroidales bacterium]